MLFTFLKLCNTTLLCHTNHKWTYHIKTSTQPPLSQSFETTPDINQPTKSARPSLVLLPSLKQVLKTQETSLFQPFPSQSNHLKREFSIITGKIPYSLIEPQVLPCVPACGCNLHPHAFQLHPTFIAPQSNLCQGGFLWKQLTS